MCNKYPTREEIISVVDDINCMFSDITYKAGLDLDSITVASYVEAHGNMLIKVLGHYVWNSEDDDRMYDYESLEEEDRVPLKDHVYVQLATLTEGLGLLVNYGMEED